MKKYRRIKGTQDILPDRSQNWQYIEKTIQNCMSNFNYREIRTPVFEQTELFARSIGQSTDIVSKEMYSFTDRGKKDITLKPEMTAPVMRAYIENNLSSISPISKLYYISPLFRQENPQAGRLRQFNQFGAEAIGSDSPALDAESILLALEVYRQLGLKNLKLKINSVGDHKCREPFKEKLEEYIKPQLEKYCPDCQNRFETNILRILDCKKNKCRDLNNNAPKLVETLCGECDNHFQNVKEMLADQKIEYSIDPYLVRGLDYYTRTVYEITSSDLGAQDSICGGGRYDLLSEELGGQQTPAVGFASGIERLLLVMEAQDILSKEPGRLQIYISPLGDSAMREAQRWVMLLRKKGYSVDRDYLGRSLKAQMREANRFKTELVIMLGETELEKEIFTVKEMDNSSQVEIEFEKIEEYLSSFFNFNK